MSKKAELIQECLNELGIKYAYYQFREPLTGENRFVSYFKVKDERFLADDSVYMNEERYAIELYTKKIELDTESSLINILGKRGLIWEYSGTQYLNDEKVYMTVFYV